MTNLMLREMKCSLLLFFIHPLSAWVLLVITASGCVKSLRNQMRRWQLDGEPEWRYISLSGSQKGERSQQSVAIHAVASGLLGHGRLKLGCIEMTACFPKWDINSLTTALPPKNVYWQGNKAHSAECINHHKTSVCSAVLAEFLKKSLMHSHQMDGWRMEAFRWCCVSLQTLCTHTFIFYITVSVYPRCYSMICRFTRELNSQHLHNVLFSLLENTRVQI